MAMRDDRRPVRARVRRPEPSAGSIVAGRPSAIRAMQRPAARRSRRPARPRPPDPTASETPPASRPRRRRGRRRRRRTAMPVIGRVGPWSGPTHVKANQTAAKTGTATATLTARRRHSGTGLGPVMSAAASSNSRHNQTPSIVVATGSAIAAGSPCSRAPERTTHAPSASDHAEGYPPHRAHRSATAARRRPSRAGRARQYPPGGVCCTAATTAKARAADARRAPEPRCAGRGANASAAKPTITAPR